MTSHRIDQLDAQLRWLNQEYKRLVFLEMSTPAPDETLQSDIARNWRDWEKTREQLQREREAFLAQRNAADRQRREGRG